MQSWLERSNSVGRDLNKPFSMDTSFEDEMVQWNFGVGSVHIHRTKNVGRNC